MAGLSPAIRQCQRGFTMQVGGTWQGYLVEAFADKQTLGSGTVAQNLLRKRYVGITGSNKVVGALEIQQVCFSRCCQLLSPGQSPSANGIVTI